MMWFGHDFYDLQEALNNASEKLGTDIYTPKLEERFRNLAQGIIVANKICPHSPTTFYVFDPPQGTICAWSSILSVVTGAQDPRWIEGTFDDMAFPCHLPGINPMNASMNMFMAFSKMTNVSKGWGKKNHSLEN